MSRLNKRLSRSTLHGAMGSVSSESITMRPDAYAYPSIQLQPLSDLDLAIKNGWRDTPQTKLPVDWRTRINK